MGAHVGDVSIQRGRSSTPVTYSAGQSILLAPVHPQTSVLCHPVSIPHGRQVNSARRIAQLQTAAPFLQPCWGSVVSAGTVAEIR